MGEKGELAAWLASWRNERGLTQEELAKAIGVGKREVERYEAGTSVPRGDNFLLLLSALGLEVKGMPTGPKSVNAELQELRQELTKHRRTMLARLGSIEEKAELRRQSFLGFSQAMLERVGALEVEAGIEAPPSSLPSSADEA